MKAVCIVPTSIPIRISALLEQRRQCANSANSNLKTYWGPHAGVVGSLLASHASKLSAVLG